MSPADTQRRAPSGIRPRELTRRLRVLRGLGVELVPRSLLGRDPAALLAEVAAEVKACRRCPLGKTRKNAVPGEGSPTARLAVVGEGPGAQEDRMGRPFVGDAGKMLDRMLENVLGLSREEVHILNVMKCRPPNNRDPKPPEIDACLGYLERQIDALNPTLIIALGAVAAKTLVGTTEGITRLRGNLFTFRGHALLPTYHPAFLLRSPERKKETLQDLLKAKSILEGEIKP